MLKNNFFKYYILLLVVHAAHIIEEILGNVYFIESFYRGLNNFLIANIALLLVPIILLYFIVCKNKIAIYLSVLYPIIILIDGIDHVIEFYLNSVAGIFTGIIFIPISVLLFFEIIKIIKKK